MGNIRLIVNEKARDYDSFLTEVKKALADYNITGLAMVAFTDDEDVEVLTGYWNLNMMQKSYAAAHIQADAMKQMVQANFVDD